MTIAEFVREKRKEYGLTQLDLSMKTGAGIRFVRELEAGSRLFASTKRTKSLLSLRLR